MWFDSLAEMFRRQGHTNRRRRRRVSGSRVECLEARRLLAFHVAAEYATASWPHDLSIAQVNTDGRPDMVTVENNQVTIRLGNADGSFGAPLGSGNPITASSVSLADFNNDGAADLVVVNGAGYGLGVHLGNGDGTFQNPQLISLPSLVEQSIRGPWHSAQSVRSIVAGDLNDDGKLDLAVGGETFFPTSVWYGYYGGTGYNYSAGGYVNVLLGNGEGSFQYVDADPLDADLDPNALGLDQRPTRLAVSDLNQDGALDVLASKNSGLAGLLGLGTGRLQQAVHSTSSWPLPSLSVGDIDGDDIPDALSSGTNEVAVQKGLGDGHFVHGALVPADFSVHSSVMGDVNHDGHLDVVATGLSHCETLDYYGGCLDETHTRFVSVMLGNGAGEFSLPIISSLGNIPGGYSRVDLELSDLTGDGLPDLVVLTDRGYEGTALVAINDGTWLEPRELSISDVSIVEGHSGSQDAVFTVTLSDNPGVTVTVNYSTSDLYDSSALAWEDYGARSGTLTFSPGVLSRTISVPVYGDRAGEGNGNFFVNLSNAMGAMIRDGQGQGTIIDDEPMVSINHPYGTDPLTVVEGDAGTTPVTFTVTLSAPYDQDVTVDYETVTGHTDDIVSATGTLRFLPGETSIEITIHVVNDLIYEETEAFNVYLKNPSANAQWGNMAAYCYIEDNDPPPAISINDVSKNEGDSGTTKFTFTLTLSAPSSSYVSVRFATSNGTATSQDYTARSGIMHFEPGVTATTVTVDVKVDRTKEANETFYFNLSDPIGATIADSQGVGTIVNDDVGSAPRPPKLNIANASTLEGHSGTRQLAFTVSLSAASLETVSVNYTTVDGTARSADNDYLPVWGLLEFLPGERTKTILVTIFGDTKREGSEAFFLDLFDPVGAGIGDGRAYGRILNDD